MGRIKRITGFIKACIIGGIAVLTAIGAEAPVQAAPNNSVTVKNTVRGGTASDACEYELSLRNWSEQFPKRNRPIYTSGGTYYFPYYDYSSPIIMYGTEYGENSHCYATGGWNETGTAVYKSYGRGGDDKLYSMSRGGISYIYGEQGNDTLIGYNGSFLNGGAGNDLLLHVNGEIMTSEFGVNDGDDVIENFHPGYGNISISGASPSQIKFAKDGNAVIITFTNGTGKITVYPYGSSDVLDGTIKLNGISYTMRILAPQTLEQGQATRADAVGAEKNGSVVNTFTLTNGSSRTLYGIPNGYSIDVEQKHNEDVKTIGVKVSPRIDKIGDYYAGGSGGTSGASPHFSYATGHMFNEGHDYEFVNASKTATAMEREIIVTNNITGDYDETFDYEISITGVSLRQSASRNDDNISGTEGNDLISGGLGNDVLRGCGGKDIFSGGADNDTLDGGSGDDSLSGGAGMDQFQFGKNDGNDTIMDFTSGMDKVVITDIGSSFSEDAAQLRWGRDGDHLIIGFSTGTGTITFPNYFSITTYVGDDIQFGPYNGVYGYVSLSDLTNDPTREVTTYRATVLSSVNPDPNEPYTHIYSFAKGSATFVAAENTLEWLEEYTQSYTVSQVLTNEQRRAGWKLDSIDIVGTGITKDETNAKASGSFTSSPETKTIVFNNSRETRTVTFNANGHGTAPEVQTVGLTDKATRPADPHETGWTFLGWYTEAGCINEFDFDTEITDNIILYAGWIDNSQITNTYTVTFDNNGHGGTPPPAQSVKHGDKATRPADPTETGWTFDGWYKEAECIYEFDFNTEITHDAVLYAKWTEGTSQNVTPTLYKRLLQNNTGTTPDMTFNFTFEQQSDWEGVSYVSKATNPTPIGNKSVTITSGSEILTSDAYVGDLTGKKLYQEKVDNVLSDFNPQVAGTYCYLVSEEKPATPLPDVTYTASQFIMLVEVEDIGGGVFKPVKITNILYKDSTGRTKADYANPPSIFDDKHELIYYNNYGSSGSTTPTGIVTNIVPFIIIGGAGVGGLVLYVMVKVKRRKKEAS